MTGIPMLKRADVTLLFHWHYFDGPLEGALEWGGKRYWFSAVFDEEREDDYGQVLKIMELTDEEWARVDHSQQLFETHVGTHTRYDRDTQRLDLSGVKGCRATYADPNEGWMPEGPAVATVRMWGEP